MVFSLTTQNRFYQPNNFGNLISIGAVQANALNGAQTGVPQPQLGCISVIPLAASTTNLANAVTATTGAGYITLTAGAGITAVSGIYNAFTNTTDTVYFFDTPRAVIITEAAGGTAVTYTVWGFDEDDVFMTENIAVAGGGGATTGTGKKAFAGVTRVWASAASTAAISVGTTDIIGLPYILLDASRIINNTFGSSLVSVGAAGQSTLVLGTATINTTAIASNSILLVSRSMLNASPVLGFLVIDTITPNTSFVVTSYTALSVAATTDVSSFNWSIVNANVTTGTIIPASVATATATTGDIRGTVTLPTASDGTTRLVVTWEMAATTFEVNQQTYKTVYGVPQYAAPYN